MDRVRLRRLHQIRRRRNQVDLALAPVIRDRQNPLEDLEDFEFTRRFRFSKNSFIRLLELVQPRLDHSLHGSSIPDHLKLMIFLHFCATGSFQYVVGDYFECSTKTVSKYVSIVSRAVASLKPQYINSVSSQRVMRKFHVTLISL